MTSNDDVGHIEKLTDDESFQIWKFQITIYFKALGVFDIVNGNQDLKEAKNNEDWLRKDAKAQKIIISTIDRKPLMHILNCDTSKDMFEKLCTIYQRNTEQQKCSLLQEFFNFSFEKGSDITLHISKLENLCFRLKSLNQNIDNDMLMSKILSTLPEQYKHFSSAWDSTPTADKTLTNLTARLIAEEMRCKLSNENEGVVAFRSTEKKCYKCNKIGHISRFCTRKQYTAESGKRCFKCNGLGHFANNCLKKETSIFCNICKKRNHQEKDCYFRNKTNQNGRVSFLTLRDKEKCNDFVIDSGSSSHMTNDKTLIKNMEEFKSDISVAKKQESMEAFGIGDIEGKPCTLKEVLYVPDLSKNLLSVNAITENDGEVLFTKHKVYTTHKNLKILEGKKQRNGLYTVKIESDHQLSKLSRLQSHESFEVEITNEDDIMNVVNKQHKKQEEKVIGKKSKRKTVKEEDSISCLLKPSIAEISDDTKNTKENIFKSLEVSTQPVTAIKTPIVTETIETIPSVEIETEKPKEFVIKAQKTKESVKKVPEEKDTPISAEVDTETPKKSKKSKHKKQSSVQEKPEVVTTVTVIKKIERYVKDEKQDTTAKPKKQRRKHKKSTALSESEKPEKSTAEKVTSQEPEVVGLPIDSTADSLMNFLDEPMAKSTVDESKPVKEEIKQVEPKTSESGTPSKKEGKKQKKKSEPENTDIVKEKQTVVVPTVTSEIKVEEIRKELVIEQPRVKTKKTKKQKSVEPEVKEDFKPEVVTPTEPAPVDKPVQKIDVVLTTVTSEINVEPSSPEKFVLTETFVVKPIFKLREGVENNLKIGYCILKSMPCIIVLLLW